SSCLCSFRSSLTRPPYLDRYSAREWDKFVPVYLSRLDFVGVAPDPVLSWLDRAHEWVCGCAKMLGRMFVLRRITTSDVSARKTQAEMDPRVSDLYAFFADVCVSGCDFDGGLMCAVRHVSLRDRKSVWKEMIGRWSARQYSQDTSGDFFVILIQVLRGDVVFGYLACDHFGNIRVVCVF